MYMCMDMYMDMYMRMYMYMCMCMSMSMSMYMSFNSIQFFVTRDNGPNTASTPASVSRSNRGPFETPL